MAKFNTFRLIAGIVGTALVTASTLYTQYCLRKQAENDAINAAYTRSRQLDLMRATAKAFAEAEHTDPDRKAVLEDTFDVIEEATGEVVFTGDYWDCEEWVHNHEDEPLHHKYYID